VRASVPEGFEPASVACGDDFASRLGSSCREASDHDHWSCGVVD